MKLELKINQSEQIKNIWLPINSEKTKLNNVKNKRNIFSTYENEDNIYEKILEDLNGAKHTIILSSFIIADDKFEDIIVKKAKQGVNVYVLTSFDIIQNKLSNEDLSEFNQEQLLQHKNMINKFVKYIKCRSARHLHAKYLMIDPSIDGKFNNETICYLSTANFDSKGLKVSPEIVMKIENPETKLNIFNFFSHGFWNEADEELTMGINEKWIIKKINKQNQPSTKLRITNIYVTTDRIVSLKDKLENMIDSNHDELILSAFTFESEQETLQKILMKNKDIKIKVITRDRKINYQFFEKLIDRFPNLEIILMKNLHAKFIITKNEYGNYNGMLFTANFAKKGLNNGYEVGVDLNEEECYVLKRIFEHWKNNSDYSYHKLVTLDKLKSYINKNVRFLKKTDFIDKEVKTRNYTEKRFKIDKVKNFKDFVEEFSIQTKKNESIEKVYLENYFLADFKFGKFDSKDFSRENYQEDELDIEGQKFKIILNKKYSYQKYLILKNQKQLKTLIKLCKDEKYQNLSILEADA